jgi:hypothetical protein
MEELVSEMTSHMAHGRVKAMARLFRQTSPGDWNKGRMVGIGGTMRGYYERNQYLKRAPKFLAVIRFRWEMGLLADSLVSKFNLPIPDGQMCIMWDYCRYLSKLHATDPTRYEFYHEISGPLTKCLDVPHRDDQGPLSLRAPLFVAAALLESEKPYDEIMAIIVEIREFMQSVVKFQQQTICANDTVRGRARDWLRTVGRKARRSLSPRKSLDARLCQ